MTSRSLVRRAVRDFEKEPTIREARRLSALTSFMTYSYIDVLRNLDVAWEKAKNAFLEGKTTSGPKGKQLLEEADTAFRFAAQGESANNRDLWHHWGLCLQIRASREPLRRRKDLYESALEKFNNALSIKPKTPSTLVHSAYVLSMLALSDGDNAGNLIQKAKERAEEAVNISPMPVTRHYYGVVLLNGYLLAPQNDKTTLLREAKAQFHSANNRKDESGAMGLACVAALNGNPSDCRRWLEESPSIKKDYVREELQFSPYLDSVQKEEWFSEFLAQMN